MIDRQSIAASVIERQDEQASGAVLAENFWRGVTTERCRLSSARKYNFATIQPKSAANYVTMTSVQGHYCLLIELKLYNVVTCIGGKTGGWDENWGAPPPQPRNAPGKHVERDIVIPIPSVRLSTKCWCYV